MSSGRTSLTRRTTVMSTAALLAMSAAISTGPASAQDAYPTRQINLITLTAPGAALDAVARTIASGLQEQTGQPVVVVNRVGAGGNIGAAEIARATPDGYTIGMITTSTHGVNPSFMPASNFDALKDFTPITLVAELNILLNVRADFPAKTLQELITYSKANPGKLSFGSAGIGTALHMTGELARAKTGLDMTHVPYQGVAKSLPDLLGGQIQVLMANPADVGGLIQDYRLRALAVASKSREPTLPNVPTFAEAGFPDVVGATWFGLAGPAGLPAPILAKLNTEIQAVMKKPETKDRLTKLGMNISLTSPAEFQAMIRSEITKWSAISALVKPPAKPAAK